MPVIKNGPKGNSLLIVFFFNIISPNPIIAPIKKARNKASSALGQPSKKPIKKASLISPTPIHLPRETRTINKKKPAAPSNY